MQILKLLNEKYIARFWTKVDKSKDCWEWTGCLNIAGQGIYGVQRAVGRVHRIAYHLLIGPIPPGMYVCHRCKNHKCVNPDHLFIGGTRDNVWNKIRYTDEVINVLGTMPDHKIAEMYNISTTAIFTERKRRNIERHRVHLGLTRANDTKNRR